jgi:hypothetical protein
MICGDVFCQPATDLSHLDGVNEACMKDIRLAGPSDLCDPSQSPKRGTVEYPSRSR